VIGLRVLGGGTVARAGSEPFEVLESKFADGRLELRWTSGAWSYQVHTQDDLSAPEWRLLLTTAADHAVIPVTEGAAFFRVMAIPTPPTTLRLSITNALTEDTSTFLSRSTTTRDAIYDGPADLNDFDLHQLVIPAATREAFALRFDGTGGFAVVTNGVEAGQAGRYAVMAGPGANEVTYTGSFTNQNGHFTFAATTSGTTRAVALHEGTPQSAGGQADSGTASALDGLIGSAAWLWCLPSFAAQQIACVGACSAQALACAFQWPPKQSYCNWVTTITWPPGTPAPECQSRCEHGCK
jgi:hypothetical protein